jgi:hypothetical protein
VSPTELLRADPIEAAVLERVIERADHWRYELDKRLAKLIVVEYAEWDRRRSRKR